MTLRSYQPVFLIGAARSGTKLVRDVIALHPVVGRVPYDINFIWRLGNESLPHDELAPEHITARTRQRIQRKVGTFHRGQELLIEKTVSNCLRVPFVDAIFPDAKYIFLIRDGYDVVESAYRQWIAPPDWNYIMGKARSFPLAAMDAPGYALKYLLNLMKKQNGRVHKTWGPRYRGIDEDVAAKDLFEVCAIQWSRSVESAHAALENIEPLRKMMIRYEDFVKQPLGSLERIATFLGLDSEPYRQSDLTSRISSGNIGKGLRLLTDTQQELLKAITGPVLSELEC